MRRTKIIDGDTPLLSSRYVRVPPLFPSFIVITNLGMPVAMNSSQLPRLFTPPRKRNSIPRPLASHIQCDDEKQSAWCRTKPLSCSSEHASYRRPRSPSGAEYHSMADSSVNSSTALGYNINSILDKTTNLRDKTTIDKREHAQTQRLDR